MPFVLWSVRPQHALAVRAHLRTHTLRVTLAEREKVRNLSDYDWRTRTRV